MSAARRRKPGGPARQVSSEHSPRKKIESGQRAGRDDLELHSYEVGAMPLLNALDRGLNNFPRNGAVLSLG